MYMKNDVFTKTALDKRDDLIKLLSKKNEELVTKQSIFQGINRTLRAIVLKNLEKKTILQETINIKQKCFALYRLK